MKGRTAAEHIAVRGAAAGPLQGVDVDLPLGQLIALSGAAGSGAHSLAFQVLVAESRRRYLQALSPHEREAVGGVGSGAAMDSVDGLPPAAVLPAAMAPAATVSSFLHVAAAMALVVQRRGEVRCPQCGGACQSWSVEAAVAHALHVAAGERVLVLAPVELSGAAAPEAVAAELQRAGFLRLRVGGSIARLDEAVAQGRLPGPGDCLEVVVDRLRLDVGAGNRLSEALRSARAMARGRVILAPESGAPPLWLNQQLTCQGCGARFPDLAEGALLPGGEAGHEVLLDSQPLSRIHGLRLDEALPFWTRVLEDGAGDGGAPAAGGPGQAILGPLDAACQSGVGYLPLDRPLGCLATGERFLLSVAAAASRDLSGILYAVAGSLAALDEEQRDRAVAALRRLAAAGNTVVVVAGDSATQRACDRVFWFAQGRPCPPPAPPPMPSRAPLLGRGERTFHLEGRGAWGNLQELSLTVPVGGLVVFTGPSGAGKSILLEQVAPLVVASRRRGPRPAAGQVRVEDGGLRRLVFLGPDPRARPGDDSVLDLLGLARPLAQLYADTPAAMERNYPVEWFLLDRPGGRCTTCEGRGVLHWDLEFMEAVSVTCPACQGRRYRPEVLEVAQRGLAISDVLELPLGEAAALFERHRRLGPPLAAAARLALGHRRLGEGAGRLDPAELTRVHLAAALPRASDRDLFVLRYPAAGQHPEDVAHLLRGLGELVATGASVWVEERHPDVLAAAAAVVEMGPGRGGEGGRIVAVRGPAVP